MRAFTLTALFLSLVVLPLTAAEQHTSTLKGVVTRDDATAFEGAFVLVRDFEQPSQNYIANKWEAQTEADGSFSFILHPGCYDIFISANVYLLPYSRRICIQVDHDSTLKVRLKADPQMQGRLRQR